MNIVRIETPTTAWHPDPNVDVYVYEWCGRLVADAMRHLTISELKELKVYMEVCCDS